MSFSYIINSSNNRNFSKGHQNIGYNYEIENIWFQVAKIHFLGFNFLICAAIELVCFRRYRKNNLTFLNRFWKTKEFFFAGKLIAGLWSDAKSKQKKIQNSATTCWKKIFQYFFMLFYVSIFVLNIFEITYRKPTSFLFSPLLHLKYIPYSSD